jgi:hypothetical protein
MLNMVSKLRSVNTIMLKANSYSDMEMAADISRSQAFHCGRARDYGSANGVLSSARWSVPMAKKRPRAMTTK